MLQLQKHTIEGINMIIKLNEVKNIYTKVSYNKTRHFNKLILHIYNMIKWLRECTMRQNDYKLLSWINHLFFLLDLVIIVQNYMDLKKL